MKGLVIKKEWLDIILSGEKNWEIRSRYTNIRGRIALIQSGSGLVVGVANLIGCAGPLSELEFNNNFSKHRVAPEVMAQFHYKKIFAWVLDNAIRLSTPISYKHPIGAVTWVNLELTL
jgi:hypothetical protein